MTISLYKKNTIIYFTAVLSLVLLFSGCGLLQSRVENNQKSVSDVVEIDVAEKNNLDTSDWQTYVNEEYGFGFEYPVDTSVLPSDSPSTNLGIANVWSILFIEYKNRLPSSAALGVYVVERSSSDVVREFKQVDDDLFLTRGESTFALNNIENITRIEKESAELSTVNYFYDLGDVGTLVFSGILSLDDGGYYSFHEDVMKTVYLIE